MAIRHIIPISGKDSLATAIVQLQRNPGLPYEFMFNPTGLELPAVFEWLEKVENFLGKPIIQVGDDLESIIEDYGYWLPSAQKRYCTKYAKIKPMERWLGKDRCFIYYGIRADENREGYENASNRLMPIMPLIEEGIDIEGVYSILLTHNLKPPVFFWQSVYDDVARIVGEHLINTLLKAWQKDMLFAWRSRANCDRCFNQRLYEWIGLLEHYPDRFWSAEKMEHLGSNGIYHWNRQLSLQEIYNKRASIKRKRVRKIVKLIRLLSQGVIIFDDNEEGFADMLSNTSCGLFCGK